MALLDCYPSTTGDGRHTTLQSHLHSPYPSHHLQDQYGIPVSSSDAGSHVQISPDQQDHLWTFRDQCGKRLQAAPGSHTNTTICKPDESFPHPQALQEAFLPSESPFSPDGLQHPQRNVSDVRHSTTPPSPPHKDELPMLAKHDSLDRPPPELPRAHDLTLRKDVTCWDKANSSSPRSEASSLPRQAPLSIREHGSSGFIRNLRAGTQYAAAELPKRKRQKLRNKKNRCVNCIKKHARCDNAVPIW